MRAFNGVESTDQRLADSFLSDSINPNARAEKISIINNI